MVLTLLRGISRPIKRRENFIPENSLVDLFGPPETDRNWMLYVGVILEVFLKNRLAVRSVVRFGGAL